VNFSGVGQQEGEREQREVAVAAVFSEVEQSREAVVEERFWEVAQEEPVPQQREAFVEMKSWEAEPRESARGQTGVVAAAMFSGVGSLEVVKGVAADHFGQPVADEMEVAAVARSWGLAAAGYSSGVADRSSEAEAEGCSSEVVVQVV